MEQAHEGDGIFEIETEDLEFRKTLEGSDDAIAEVRYHVRSMADAPIACRVRNPIPDELSRSDAYIHSENDEWSVSDDGIVTFEGRLSPGDETSTTVTLNVQHVPNVDPLGPEPSIDIARPQDVTDGSADRLDSANEWDGANDESEPPATVPIEIPDEVFDDGGEGDSVEEGVVRSNQSGADTLDLSFERQESDTSDRSSNGSEYQREDNAQDGSDRGRSGTNRSTIEELLAELEGEPESSESIERLRELLQIENGESNGDRGTIKAKVEHLRREVSDLVVYREALAEFIDEHGTGTEVVRDFERRFEQHDDRLDTLEGTVRKTRNEIDDVRATVTAIETDVDRIDDRLEAFETVRADVDQLKAKLRDSTSKHDDELEALATELASLSRQLDRTTTALESDVASVQAEVEEARQWRESLGNALTGHESTDDE